jgi:hypothetical protein
MFKKALLYFLGLCLFSVHAFAQIQVPFTNRFFAARTAAGSCFVFIHKDGFTFVSGTRGNRNAVNLSYDATGGINDAFIAGNYFFMKFEKTLYCYDLAKLTDKNNDGRNFGSIRQLRISDNEIQNINSISLYEDTFYYTKENDSRIYRFSAAENKVNIPVPNVSINSGGIKQVVYVPMDEKRNREYRSTKAGIDRIIATYKSMGNATPDKTGIEKAALSVPPGQRTNNDGVYAEIKKYLANQYRYDSSSFMEFKSLAKIAGATEDAENFIDTIKTGSPPLPANILSDFYKADSDYRLYSSDEELQRQRGDITARINTVKAGFTGVWGNNYEDKKRIFDILRTTEYRWIDSTGAFSANNDKLRKFGKEIDSLFRGSRLDLIFKNKEHERYQRYVVLYEFYTFVADAYIEKQKTGYRNANVLSEINKIGLNVYEIQTALFNDSSTDYKTTYNKLLDLNKEYVNIAENLKQKAADALKIRNERLIPIVNNSAARYRNELHDAIKKISPAGLGDYDASYMNYCFVSDNDNRISGFKITEQINKNDLLSNNINDAGEKYVFIRPSDYPLLSIAKDAVYVPTSKKSIAAFDITRANILETRIEPLVINEGIFYILKNENDLSNSQYMVTNDGKLLKLSVDGGKIKRQQIGTLGENDTVLVTSDNVYIFSGAGVLKNGSPESIRIKACNSGDIYTMALRNQQFIIQ